MQRSRLANPRVVVRALVGSLLVGCSRDQRAAVDAAAPAEVSVGVDAPVVAPAHVALEDTCIRHEDCVVVDLFVDGPLRCCIACGGQAAANKKTAQSFIAACSEERKARECPVYECAAPIVDARCVGRHCQLAPRPR